MAARFGIRCWGASPPWARAQAPDPGLVKLNLDSPGRRWDGRRRWHQHALGRVGPRERLVVGASGGSSRAKVAPGSAGRNPPTEAMLLAPLSSLEVLPMRCRSVLTSSVTRNCLRNLIWHYIGVDIGDIS